MSKHKKFIIKTILLCILFFFCMENVSYQNLYVLRASVLGEKNFFSFFTKTDEFLGNGLQQLGNLLISAGNSLNYPRAVSANFVNAPIIKQNPKPTRHAQTLQKTDPPAVPPVIPDSPVEKTISHTSGNVDINKAISIKNQTSYSVNTSALSAKGAPFSMKSGNESPQVLILHTHGSESYTPSEKYNFRHTSNSRTTDLDYNVVRVGSELATHLKENGINVIHDPTMYDYPDYNSSYDNAYYSIQAMLKKYPTISIVIDLHRDAVNTETGETVKLVADVDGKKAAQIMFVVGTDECGFSHPYWEFNLKFASMIQQNLYKKSPSLVRPINLRTSRFNQHFTKGSLIVEVGTNGNTLDEALLSAEYLAKAITATIPELK